MPISLALKVELKLVQAALADFLLDQVEGLKSSASLKRHSCEVLVLYQDRSLSPFAYRAKAASSVLNRPLKALALLISGGERAFFLNLQDLLQLALAPQLRGLGDSTRDWKRLAEFVERTSPSRLMAHVLDGREGLVLVLSSRSGNLEVSVATLVSMALSADL